MQKTLEDMVEDMEIDDISLDVRKKHDLRTWLIWLRTWLRTWKLLIFR